MARASDLAAEDRQDVLVKYGDFDTTLETPGKDSRPGGPVEQWFKATVANGGTVTFPEEFETACLGVQLTLVASLAIGPVAYGVDDSALSATGFKVYHEGVGVRTFFIRAVGH